MSRKFNIVKKHFDDGDWSVAMVRNAVVKGWITAIEFEEITGEQYSAE